MKSPFRNPYFLAFLSAIFSFLLIKLIEIEITIEEEKKKLSFIKALNGVFDNDDEIEIIDNEQ